MAVPLGVGDVLAEAGDLTVELLGRASTWQKTYGGTIERALLSTGAVAEDVLTAALEKTYGLPGVSRATLAASDPDVVDCLPAKERRRFRAIPFALSGNRLKVATCDPRNLVLQKNLAAATGFEVDVYITPEPVLEDLLQRFEGQAAGTAPASPIVSDSVDRLGRALLAEALRIEATELELGTDTRGAFLRTFDAEQLVLARRFSDAHLVLLTGWLQDRFQRPEGFIVEGDRSGGRVERRLELLAVDAHRVRIRLHPFEKDGNAASVSRVDVSCRHERSEGFVFCPLCGDVL
jgi:Type II secretion system (T2SS), protein E, N-terminal domain